jgi:hypothetical protein
MALGDEVDEIFRREVKSLPAYAKAQAASGSGLAPRVDEMNQLLMGLASAAQRSFHLLAKRIESMREPETFCRLSRTPGPTTQAGAPRFELVCHSASTRTSDGWRRLCRGRSAVERGFGRLKHRYGLTILGVRGIERVRLRADSGDPRAPRPSSCPSADCSTRGVSRGIVASRLAR